MSSRPDPTELRRRFARDCSNCRQPIMWAWTVTGDRMPIDADPVDNGNVMAFVDGRRLRVDVIGDAPTRRKLRLGHWPLYRHHRLSCPMADQWARQTKRKTAPPPVDTPTAPEGSALW